VLDETQLRRAKLSEFITGDRLDEVKIEAVLAFMQKHTRPVKAPRLGIIGEDHLRTRMLELSIKPESFEYLPQGRQDGPALCPGICVRLA
jgi:hypothetical protein